MTTAVTAIKANLGVTAFAYLFTIMAAGWSLLWAIALSGTMEQTVTCDEQGACDLSYGLLFLLFLSFFFAHQVLQVSAKCLGALPVFLCTRSNQSFAELGTRHRGGGCW